LSAYSLPSPSLLQPELLSLISAFHLILLCTIRQMSCRKWWVGFNVVNIYNVTNREDTWVILVQAKQIYLPLTLNRVSKGDAILIKVREMWLSSIENFISNDVYYVILLHNAICLLLVLKCWFNLKYSILIWKIREQQLLIIVLLLGAKFLVR
jgi:hypothetical protein